MNAIDRIGLAVAKPRLALELANDRSNTGRAGTDLLAMIALLLVGTQVRWAVAAVWLGIAVDPMLGMRAFIHIITRALTPDLGALMIAAAAIWLGSGQRRELGRAFDMACVAVIPSVVVHMTAQVAIDASRRVPPDPARWAVDGIAGVWVVALVVLAVMVARSDPSGRSPVLAPGGRRAGAAIAVAALVGMIVHGTWLCRNADQVRPLTHGATAPPLQLPRISSSGDLGTLVSLTPGKTAVLDFWATWCSPCLKGLPKLDAFARRHPEVDVFAINLDDARAARELFDAAGYELTLLADDGNVSQRYGVTSIPHTVVIDSVGRVRAISGGRTMDLEAEVRRP